jgi:hypothetical protein
VNIAAKSPATKATTIPERCFRGFGRRIWGSLIPATRSMAAAQTVFFITRNYAVD